MTISELVERLNAIQSANGDVPVQFFNFGFRVLEDVSVVKFEEADPFHPMSQEPPPGLRTVPIGKVVIE